jgi:protein-disulfide isomerase-like protein with CxxC motif
MKKGLKTAIVAIALVTAGMGAFATKANYAPKIADPVYNWQHLNRTTGLPDGNDLFDKTIVEARAAYGCNDLSFDPCANGNGTAGTVTIFYN